MTSTASPAAASMKGINGPDSRYQAVIVPMFVVLRYAEIRQGTTAHRRTRSRGARHMPPTELADSAPVAKLRGVASLAFRSSSLLCASFRAASTLPSFLPHAPSRARARAPPGGGRIRRPGWPAHAQEALLARVDLARTRGDSAARIWVIMVGDFQCPACRLWHGESFPRVMSEYVRTRKVRIAFVNYPLNIHANAVVASEAAMCAAAQGRFWEMHDALYHDQPTWEGRRDPRPAFATLAIRAGVDTVAWGTCMRMRTTLPLVTSDRERIASGPGFRSTPSFIVGTQTVVGAVPFDSLRKVIEAQLRAVARPDTTKGPESGRSARQQP
jgi:protein-disulfide isomerase